MANDHAQTQLKIPRILESIQLDKIKLDQLPMGVNQKESRILQLLTIFRKLALIDHLLKFFPETCETKLDQLMKRVLLVKRQCQGENADLRKLPIPSVDQQGSSTQPSINCASFPCFSQLPALVRHKILGYLNNACDKWNTAQAIPEAAELMDWNLASLKLELVLPILLDHETQKQFSTDMNNLVEAGEPFKTVVENYFDDKIMRSFEGYVCLHSVEFPIRNRIDNRRFPVQVLWQSTQSSPEALQYLRANSDKVWAIQFDNLDDEMTLHGVVDMIGTFLACTPMLRGIGVFIPEDFATTLQDGEELLVATDFPVLPKLKLLNLTGGKHHWWVNKLLLETYSKQIECLCIVPLRLPASISHEDFPNLNVLVIHVIQSHHDWILKKNMDRYCSSLDVFHGCPIKTIRLVFENFGSFGTRLAMLSGRLLLAAHRFATTLEELGVVLEVKLSRANNIGCATTIADIEFPKVKKLVIKDHPGSWDLPLHFPVLEDLTIKLSNFNLNKDWYFSEYGGLDLSPQRSYMHTSNIWKLLPYLQRITIASNVSVFETCEIWRLTRSECLNFQNT